MIAERQRALTVALQSHRTQNMISNQLHICAASETYQPLSAVLFSNPPLLIDRFLKCACYYRNVHVHVHTVHILQEGLLVEKMAKQNAKHEKDRPIHAYHTYSLNRVNI